MNKICPLPWNHLSVQQNGDFRVCCQAVYPPFAKIYDENGMMNIQTHSVDEARNSQLSIDIRRSQLAGEENQACKLCYDQERLGQTSKRIHMLREYSIEKIKNSDPSGRIDTKEFPLEYWDLRFGNLCNLACRSCGPNDSSQWYDDFVALNGETKTQFNFYGAKDYPLRRVYDSWVLRSSDFDYYESEEVWDKIKQTLPHINRLYLTGGEPLINKSNRRLLDLCIESGLASKIILEYNTNMTTVPDWLFDTWSKFYRVSIGCSIDAIGSLASYIRYPSNWKRIEDNLNLLGYSYHRNIQAKFSTTVSVYNVLHYPDLLKWLDEKNYYRIRNIPSYHMLDGPPWLNVQVLPKEAKTYIEEYYEDWLSQNDNDAWTKQLREIIAHMWAKDLTQYLPKLRHHTLVLDRRRKQNGREYLPWLFDILDKILDQEHIDQYW